MDPRKPNRGRHRDCRQVPPLLLRTYPNINVLLETEDYVGRLTSKIAGNKAQTDQSLHKARLGIILTSVSLP